MSEIGAWIPVVSSNVAAIMWDSGALYVKFHRKKKGKIIGDTMYQYDGVPVETYIEYLSAASKGKFNHQQVKGKFPYTKVY